MTEMKPGESKIVTVNSGSWESPRPFSITLPSEWVKTHTKQGNRKVKLVCIESHKEGSYLEVHPVGD